MGLDRVSRKRSSSVAGSSMVDLLCGSMQLRCS